MFRNDFTIPMTSENYFLHIRNAVVVTPICIVDWIEFSLNDFTKITFSSFICTYLYYKQLHNLPKSNFV